MRRVTYWPFPTRSAKSQIGRVNPDFKSYVKQGSNCKENLEYFWESFQFERRWGNILSVFKVR